MQIHFHFAMITLGQTEVTDNNFFFLKMKCREVASIVIIACDTFHQQSHLETVASNVPRTYLAWIVPHTCDLQASAFIEMNKRQTVWNRLQDEMTAKRKRPDPRGKGKGKKSGSAPHELIVQRLASEPDNKQTFRPVQPREFVAFPYEDLTLTNLKKACADHYSLPASLCDVLVTNKGPSCTSIEQIPHRKDKVRVLQMHV